MKKNNKLNVFFQFLLLFVLLKSLILGGMNTFSFSKEYFSFNTLLIN
jgi:hypothetical protein